MGGGGKVIGRRKAVLTGCWNRRYKAMRCQRRIPRQAGYTGWRKGQERISSSGRERGE